ncbi:MAG: M48 family metallopeptidase [Myxococcota bacterium]
MGTASLRASGDRDLAKILLEDRDIRKAIDKLYEDRIDDTRRQLLATAVRITRGMAPQLHEHVNHCRATLAVERPVELYVLANPSFNAFSYASEGERIFIGITSSLLEALDDGELRFVLGHELGHQVFGHHDIPVAAILHRRMGKSGVRAEQALRLFSWQRFAEISADRAGLVCAGALEPSGRAFFKLSSGLSGELAVMFDLEAYLAQVGDIAAEVDKAREDRKQNSDEVRPDWFASHPFSPLRARATQLCADSVICTPDGMSVEELEAQVQQLMSLMDPSYLHDRSDTGEAMRRLLFAGGVLVAAADGAIDEPEVAALQDFLGVGNVPSRLAPEALERDLERRVEYVKQHVPPLRCAQVIRDLCVIALADGRVEDSEIAVIRRLAEKVGVEALVVDRALVAARAELD